MAQKAKRVKHDAYLTTPEVAAAVVEDVLRTVEGRPALLRSREVLEVLEPSAGEGAFVAALLNAQQVGVSMRHTWVTAVEPREKARTKIWSQHVPHPQLTLCPATFEAYVRLSPNMFFDLVIGNPPFSRAEEHIKLARERARWVAFLLRLSMLGSQRRASTLWSQPGLYSVRPLARRPAFIRPGKPLRSDNSEYAIFLWQRGYQGVAQLLPPLDVPLASRRRVG